jgi:hypothetical protein
LRSILKASECGPACGRMLRIRLGMAGTSPAKTAAADRDPAMN